jgi:hypothetical protein
VALVSRRIPVDPDGKYLMSGWVWDEVGSATIGRSCFDPVVEPLSPYYIFGYQGQPLQAWFHYAELSLPFPGIKPQFCETLLMNDANSNRPAYWENIIWFRLLLP